MTGQVKEDVLARWGELGVEVRDGRLGFAPTLLPRAEFLVGGRRAGRRAVGGPSCRWRWSPAPWRSPSARCRSSTGS
jgi:hypothetical protein